MAHARMAHVVPQAQHAQHLAVYDVHGMHAAPPWTGTQIMPLNTAPRRTCQGASSSLPPAPISAALRFCPAADAMHGPCAVWADCLPAY
jgi:hypothetical protein